MRNGRTSVKLRRPIADARIRPAETIICGNAYCAKDFGLDRQRFYATNNRPRVTCPFCGTYVALS